jgi:hypothetical protein
VNPPGDHLYFTSPDTGPAESAVAARLLCRSQRACIGVFLGRPLFGFRSNSSSTLLVRKTQVSQESLYASYAAATGPGTRSHGTGSQPTPPPGEISESPDMGWALRVTVWTEPSNTSDLAPPLVPLWNRVTSGPGSVWLHCGIDGRPEE